MWLRDSLLYRIATFGITSWRDKWLFYPLYDYATASGDS